MDGWGADCGEGRAWEALKGCGGVWGLWAASEELGEKRELREREFVMVIWVVGSAGVGFK